MIISSNWAACTVKRFSQTSYNISHWGFANSESFSLMIFARAPQFAFSRWQFCLDHFSIFFFIIYFLFKISHRHLVYTFAYVQLVYPIFIILVPQRVLRKRFNQIKKNYSRQEQKAWRAIKNYYSIQSNSAITKSAKTNCQL
jgi:hypothetical protein